MPTAHDVAAYILKKRGKMTAMKLQKLVYYAQAWSLVWDDRPLFREPIEAWVNGPVVRSLYNDHRGQFEVRSWPKGNIEKLDAKAKESIDAVLEFYGGKSSQWLSDLTHSEEPWKLARQGVPPMEHCDHEITHASMAEYYSAIASRQA